jgi:outer membrane protein assembly factor BamB
MIIKPKYWLLLLVGLVLFSCKQQDAPKTTLYISNNNGELYSINLQTDRLNWKIAGDTGRTELSYFSLKPTSIIKAYTNKHIVEIDKATGKIKWTYQDKLSANHSYYHYDFNNVIDAFFSQYPVLYHNTMVYAGTQGELKRLISRQRKYCGHIRLISLSIFRQRLSVGSWPLNFGYRVVTLDPASGKQLHSIDFETPIPNETTVDGDYIYVADEHGQAFALDSTLNKLWSFIPQNKDPGSSKVIAGKNEILYGERAIILLDKKTGKAKWETTLPGEASAPIVRD